MKYYKRKLLLSLIIISYIFSSAACDFIVKSTDNEPDTDFSVSETQDSPKVNSSKTDSDINSDKDNSKDKDKSSDKDDKKDSDTSHKTEKDSSKASSSSKASASSSSSASSSRSAASSKTASSTSSTASTASSSEVKVTGISLNFYDLTLDIGQTRMPVVTMSPFNATNKNEIWKSSDEKVATVDKNGTIKAIGEGKCVVTVTSESNPKIEAKVNVTVKGKQKVESLEVDKTEVNIKVGETAMPRVTMLPLTADTLAEKWTSDNESVAVVDIYGNITGVGEGTCTVTVTSVSNEKLSKEIKVTVKKADKKDTDNDNGSKEDPNYTNVYIDGVLIVNKTYGLSSDYNPGGLTSECRAAFEEMRKDAANDGMYIYIESGFRSYEDQEYLYNMYVQRDGKEAADTFSARPGHSEHQTGLTIDCNDASSNFGYTDEAQWLADHCWEYGFIIRYPQGKESVTGYKYEPWHIRYVGYDLAKELYFNNETLEEHFGITSEYRD